MVAAPLHDGRGHFKFSFLSTGICVKLLSELLQVEFLEVVQKSEVLQLEGVLNSINIYVKLLNLFRLHIHPLPGNLLLVHREIHREMSHHIIRQVIAFHLYYRLQLLLSVIFCFFNMHRDSSAC